MNEFELYECQQFIQQVVNAFEPVIDAIRSIFEEIIERVRALYEALTRSLLSFRLASIGIPMKTAEWIAWHLPWAWVPVTWAWVPILGPPI